MNVVVFTVDQLQFALPAAQTVEVIPVVNTRPVAQMPACVLGLIDYRGSLIPLIDLSKLLRIPARELTMAHRILVLRPSMERQAPPFGALLVDHVHGLADVEFTSDDAIDSSRTQLTDERRVLGPLARCENGFLQRIEVQPLAKLCALSTSDSC